MGRPKESLPFRGTTFLGHAVDLLLDCAWPVVVVAREPGQQLPPYNIESDTVADETPGSGPLGAIATGMEALLGSGNASPADAVFVTGCDHPYLTGESVSWLANQLGDAQLAIPRADGHLQALCAVYRLDTLPVIRQMLKEGIDTPRSLAERVRTNFVDEAKLRSFDPAMQFWKSVNTPEEFAALEKQGGSR
ncbi:MAG: putative molybdopterin-guanine dinucleotide biosynthesis protein [Planctomycetota bacterium]